MNKIRSSKYHSVFLTINYLFIVCFFIRIPVLKNKLEILWGIFACCIFIFTQKKLRLDLHDILLTVTMVLYALITHKNFAGILDIVLLPLIFALLGKYLVYDLEDTPDLEQNIYIMILLIVIGYSVHGFLNTLNLFELGIVSVQRYWNDFWDNTFTPATQHVIYYLPAMAMLFPAVLYMRKHVLPGIGIIILNVFFLFISVVTTSRISLVICPLILIWELFLWCLLNRRRIDWNKAVKKILPCCLAGMILIILFLWTYLNNEAAAARFSWLERDGGILNNIRFKAHFAVIRQMPLYPMGGYHMDLAGLQYAHNVWLDLANAAGVLPFATFTGYAILTFINLMKLLRSDTAAQEIKYIISGLYLALFLFYMVEAALEASVLNILPWSYINGIISAYLSLLKKNTQLQ